MLVYPPEFKLHNNITYCCTYQVVWCPKYRRKVLVDGVETRLEAIVHTVCAEHGAHVLELEVLPDQVRLLVQCDPHFGIHRLVKCCKGQSSCLLRAEFPHLRKRLPSLWTHSYFVSTVGGAPPALIEQYVEAQKHS